MTKSLSKKELIAELSRTVEITRKEVRKVLDELAEIAYRETVNGFTVPGICKLKIARRQASKRRNPVTGDLMLVDEHDIVKISPLKKARDTIAPKSDNLITVINEPVQPPVPPAQSAPELEEEADVITFACPTCGQEIEAPTSMLDMEAECPTCGIGLVVGEEEPLAFATVESRTEEGGKPFQPMENTNTMRLDLSTLGLK